MISAGTEMIGSVGGPRVSQDGEAPSHGRSPRMTRVAEVGTISLLVARMVFFSLSWLPAGGHEQWSQLRTSRYLKRPLTTSIGSSNNSSALTHPHPPPTNPSPPRRHLGLAPFHEEMGREYQSPHNAYVTHCRIKVASGHTCAILS